MSNKSFTPLYRSHDVRPETSHRTVTLFFPSSVQVNKLNAHSAANFLCNINIKAYDLIVFIGIAHGLEGSVKTENELSAVKHFLE